MVLILDLNFPHLALIHNIELKLFIMDPFQLNKIRKDFLQKENKFFIFLQNLVFMFFPYIFLIFLSLTFQFQDYILLLLPFFQILEIVVLFLQNLKNMPPLTIWIPQKFVIDYHMSLIPKFQLELLKWIFHI